MTTRIIKFRAWDKKHNKMLYGVSTGTVKVWDENAPLLSQESSCSEDCEFERYTGLKDKNGKEICEGDIISQTVIEGLQDGYYPKYEVFWDEDFYTWGLKDIAGDDGNDTELSIFARRGTNGASKEVEVIGNIHQDKDLIKDRK